MDLNSQNKSIISVTLKSTTYTGIPKHERSRSQRNRL